MRLRSKRTRAGLFAAITLLIGATWLVALPRFAQRAVISESIERLDSRGVDPGALFYSDHRLAWD